MAGGFQPRFVDLVRNYTTTTGTDDFVLGPAVNGFADFAEACQVGDSFYYSATGVDTPAETEVGRGTLLAGGVISRDPIGGTKTSFSSGTKSIGLIAAADWFTSVDAASGVPSRDVLAALGQRGSAALLTEAGREGHFIFDPSDLSAEVAADPMQGIHVAPDSDPSGASGAWVRKFDGPVWVTWFGAKGDKVTDDAPAIMAAASLFTGKAVTLYFPAHVGVGKYRCGSQLVFTSMVHLKGDGWSNNPGSVNGVSFDFPDFLYGSILYCDVGVAGPLFRFYTDSDTVAAATDQFWDSTASRIDDLMILSANNGTTALAGNHGIDSRVLLFLNRVWVRGFGDVGVRIEASLANSGGYKYGNANDSHLTTVHSSGNNGDGFYFAGSDANVIKLTACASMANGGWGYNDDSLIGNTYDTCLNEANVTGSFRSSSVGATHTYLNCENEGGLTSFAGQVNVLGGTLGQDASHPRNSPAYVVNGGLAIRYPFRHLNYVSSPVTGAMIGSKENDCAAFSWGIDENSGYGEWAWKRGARSTNYWGFQFAGSSGTCSMQIPDGTTTTGRNYAAEFPQGIVLGNLLGSQTGLIYAGTAAPTSGSWQQGDIVINNSPSTGAVFAWRCTAAGTPGTWESISAVGSKIVLTTPTGWSAPTSVIIGYSASDGLFATGNGLVYDLAIYDSAGSGAILVPHGGNDLRSTKGITSSHATAGVGYRPGAGGTVVQAASKSTGVSLNKVCGEITMNGAALAAGSSVSFVLTNSAIAAADNLILNHVTAGTFGAYALNGRCAAGSATIDVTNISGTSLSEAIVLRFTLLKSVTA